MRVSANVAALARARWYEYVSRFMFGGAMTALAGIIAKEYGPSIGGLFLAFPAIFPAGATLIEKHEKEKKQQVGMDGRVRGRQAAALEAAGAAMGAFGLIGFAILVWKLITGFSSAAVLSIGTMVWLAVSISVWKARQVWTKSLRL